jgi:hypothetical protein
VKRHDWLQIALASVSGVVAYYLWTSQHVAVRPEGLVLALHEVTENLGDWVHRLRAALR